MLTSPPQSRLCIVILGLTITSSWGNGHATTFRSLIRGLRNRGHHVLFLERDQPWYADNRDLPNPPYCKTALYTQTEAIRHDWARDIAQADAVIVGSYVPDGIVIGDMVQAMAGGVTAFYDIDTPVTLRALADGSCPYLNPALIRGYDLYLSFTGGPTLRELEMNFAAPCARALYCSADPDLCHPDRAGSLQWDLGYLGTYSADRQPVLDRLLCDPAQRWARGRFAVAGPQYPADIGWPANCTRIEHLAPGQLAEFYGAQRYTLNVTRADMVQRGWSPSVRLFEAAASGTPIISDSWPGLETLFRPGQEILTARDSADVLQILQEMPEASRLDIANQARARVLASHTGDCRATELEAMLLEQMERRAA